MEIIINNLNSYKLGTFTQHILSYYLELTKTEEEPEKFKILILKENLAQLYNYYKNDFSQNLEKNIFLKIEAIKSSRNLKDIIKNLKEILILTNEKQQG